MSTKIFAVLAAATALTLTACTDAPPEDETATDTSAAADCGPLPASDVTSPEGWIGYLAEHPDSVGLVIDNGQGNVVTHRADEPQPLASQSRSSISPRTRRPLRTATSTPPNRSPSPNGNAGTSRTRTAAHTPPRWNASRHRRGHCRSRRPGDRDDPGERQRRTRLLTRSARRRRADGSRRAGRLGRLRTAHPARQYARVRGTGGHRRRPVGHRAALRGRSRLPREILGLLQQPDVLPDDPFGEMDRIQRDDNAGTADRIAGIHRAIADGSFGSGADIARGHLEWQPAPPGAEGLGFKGGSCPGYSPRR